MLGAAVVLSLLFVALVLLTYLTVGKKRTVRGLFIPAAEAAEVGAFMIAMVVVLGSRGSR